MAFLHPATIVDKLNITPGIKAADFGCGSGHFTVEMAKRAGNNGTVYAFDIQEGVLSALKSKVALEHLNNVEMRRANLEEREGTQLAQNILDFVLLCNVFFQVENKGALVDEAFRVLKPGGKVAVIDWTPGSGGIGPPAEARIGKDTISNMFAEKNFSFEREFEADDLHYGIIFMKPEA